MDYPKTLVEAARVFGDEDTAREFVAAMRWPGGEPVCPKCGNVGAWEVKSRRGVYKCKGCRKQFSIRVGTIFEDSPLPLGRWLVGIWLVANAKNGISSYETGRALGISQKSAWHLNHRIRLAMQVGTFEKLSGDVEADETYVCGLAKFTHKEVRERRITGTGGKDKAVVLGMVERKGQARTKTIPDTAAATAHAEVRAAVEPGSRLFTDSANWLRRAGRRLRA